MSVETPEAKVPSDQVPEPSQEGRWGRALREITQSNATVVLFAIVGALLLAGVLIAAANPDVQRTAGYIFARPLDFISAVWNSITGAYTSLFRGAVFDFNANDTARMFKPITETLTAATPLIFAGLGLGIGFRSGIFNIGAQG